MSPRTYWDVCIRRGHGRVSEDYALMMMMMMMLLQVRSSSLKAASKSEPLGIGEAVCPSRDISDNVQSELGINELTL